MSDNLFNEFSGDSVDQSELEQLLLMHFNGSSSIDENEIHYAHPGIDTPALVLKYSRDGELAEIHPGPGIRSDDIDQLRSKIYRQLVQSNGLEVGQLALFAHVPTVGYFRYKDLFQISPMPDEAPRPKFLIGDHPLFLQYKYQASIDSQISMLRRTRVGRELELLLVALTSRVTGCIQNVVRYHWSIISDVGNPANWKSLYCQEGYTWPNANGIGATFFSNDGINPITRTKAQDHYNQLGISVGQTLDLPDLLEQLVDTYFSMTQEGRDRFIRASFWFQYAQRVGRISHSGSFTALVSSVEALMSEARPVSQCPTCERPIGAGPTKRFVDFVASYAGAGLSNTQRRELYSLRSALSHGGSLMHSDRFGWGSRMTSNSLSEWSSERTMWQVVRLVLVNWLIAQKTGLSS